MYLTNHFIPAEELQLTRQKLWVWTEERTFIFLRYWIAVFLQENKVGQNLQKFWKRSISSIFLLSKYLNYKIDPFRNCFYKPAPGRMYWLSEGQICHPEQNKTFGRQRRRGRRIKDYRGEEREIEADNQSFTKCLSHADSLYGCLRFNFLYWNCHLSSKNKIIPVMCVTSEWSGGKDDHKLESFYNHLTLPLHELDFKGGGWSSGKSGVVLW